MKKKFLKILISFTLFFNILFSFNITNFNNKFFIKNNTQIVYATTIDNNTKYDSISLKYNQLNIINEQLYMDNLEVRRSVIDEIVIHHSGGENTTVEDINRMHSEKGWGGIGYNYYIRKDGSIYKGRDIKYVGAHCIGKNYNSIGICLEGNFEYNKPTNKQMGSLLALTTGLSKTYDIHTISRHKDTNSTDCPGRYFDWETFKEVYNNILKN